MSDFPPSSTGNWTIYSVQKTLPALGHVGGVLGSHDYLVLVKPDGTIASEMHGVPSDHFVVNGGDPGNYLHVKIKQPNDYMSDQTITSAKPVFSGSQDDMQSLFQTGYKAVADALDSTHMLYDGAEIFGHAVNSNSVWNTALKAMGVKDTSQFDGPDSTPGNGVDLRTEPTNNDWFGTSKDPWSPNPSFTTAPSNSTSSADAPGPTWIVPGVLAVGPNDQLIATDASPSGTSGSASQSFRVVSSGGSAPTTTTEDTTNSASIGNPAITPVFPSHGTPFAAVATTGAGAPSSIEEIDQANADGRAQLIQRLQDMEAMLDSLDEASKLPERDDRSDELDYGRSG